MSDSHIDDLRAAATLAKSQHARTLVSSIATFFLLPAFTAVVGWVGAKIETKLEVAQISADMKTLTGEVANLRSQQGDLVKTINGLSSESDDAPGKLFVLQRDMSWAYRRIVEATAIALAYEPDRRKREKRKAAELPLAGYDNRRREHMPPNAAAGEALSEIALP